VTLAALSVSAQQGAGGTRQLSDAQDGGDYRFTVLDPDAPTASRIEDVNFDGDETLNAIHGGSFSEQFGAADFVGTGSAQYGSSSGQTRSVPIVTWRRGAAADAPRLVLRRLEEIPKTASNAPSTGNTTESVRLVDLRSGDRRGIQVFGSRAPTAAVPTVGTAVVYQGEVYANVLEPSGKFEEFVGDARIIVNFVQGTFVGQILASQGELSPSASPSFSIEFVGSISGGTLRSQRADFNAANLTAGTLRGNLFGANADEIGLVISATGTNGTLMLGMVGGRQP
jgi:hypothetical protein